MTTFLAILILLVSVAAVAWPLLKRIGSREAHALVEDAAVSEMLARKDAALLAISELESDFEMGNLSESDYLELRNKYDEQAVTVLRAVDELHRERVSDEVSRLDEEIEARVARMRGAGDGKRGASGGPCPGCGALQGPDAMFCPRCGTALGSRCPDCAAAVAADDRFCFRCGTTLGTLMNK
jgi:hypothetical protein